MKGKFIVIEGLDGSGKATQSKLLTEYLRNQKVSVKQVSFPVYDSDSSALVRMYLAGKFGPKADDVNAYAASCFYAADRYASYKMDWGKEYESGSVIIADRYTTSNAIHQCAKLEPSAWNDYLEWLFDFEYNKLEIPRPDAVIYLRVPPEVSQQLMTKRYGGEETKKDIHEKDLEYLARSRKAADYCSRYLGWKVVECVRDGNMRPIEEIQSDIVRLVGYESIKK